MIGACGFVKCFTCLYRRVQVHPPVFGSGCYGDTIDLVTLPAVLRQASRPARPLALLELYQEATARHGCHWTTDLLRTAREAGSAEYAYEVMYSLEDVAERTADELRLSRRGPRRRELDRPEAGRLGPQRGAGGEERQRRAHEPRDRASHAAKIHGKQS